MNKHFLSRRQFNALCAAVGLSLPSAGRMGALSGASVLAAAFHHGPSSCGTAPLSRRSVKAHPERCAISEGLGKVNGSGGCSDRVLERVNDPGRIITEQFTSERRVIRPAMHFLVGSEYLRPLGGCLLTQRNKINGLASSGRFFGASGCHHLTDHRWQQSRRMVPADQVEAFKRLIDKVERVSGVSKCPLGLRRE